ncbi:MAG: ABC transporter ATP-binding protein [Myxococcota bacterium]
MLTPVRALWALTRGARATYARAFAALFASALLLYAVPLVPRAVLDGVLTRDPAPSASVDTTLRLLGGRAFVADHLWVAALAMLGGTVAAGAFTFLCGRWSAQASEGIVRRLRERVYDHLQRLPCRFFDGAETGDLLQRCTSDTETVRLFFANQAVEIGRAVFMAAVAVPVMLAVDPRMAAVALVGMPVIAVYSVLFFLRIRKSFEAADEAEGDLTTVTQEALTGVRVVRAFARQDHEISRFATRNGAYRDADYRVYALMARFWSLSDLVTFGQQVLVVGAGIAWMLRGELAVGAFFYFLTAVHLLLVPLRQLGRIVADFGKATVAIGRLDAILAEAPEPAPLRPRPVPSRGGAIAVEGVTFAYGAGPPALIDVTLTIPPRSTVAIVGPSGAGKSTLVALLLRLYDPTAGAVRLDGVDLRELDTRALRRRIGVVLQQPFLYAKPVAENLRLARPTATEAEVEQAAVAADIHGALLRLPQGYDTLVGDRGLTLSGGQRQRLALARALLQRPDVLILDDALSAVDTRTERTILAHLAERRGRQTTLVIGHRPSTLALADRVIVLDGGRLVEAGTAADLRRAGGAWAELCGDAAPAGAAR